MNINNSPKFSLEDYKKSKRGKELIMWTKKFIDKYRKDLESLAQK